MMQFQPSRYSGGYGAAPAPEPMQLVVSVEPKPKPKPSLSPGLVLAGVTGLLLAGPLMVSPWIVKQFKPEWPYGKRVATGFVVSFGVGALTRIVGSASGSSEKD